MFIAEEKIENTKMAIIIINGEYNDNESKNEYYNKLRMMKIQKEEINSVKTEIETIKQDMADIKSMMVKLLEKG